MEIYETNNNFRIVNITRSKDSLVLNDDNEKNVLFLLLPYLAVDKKNQTATTILKSQFVKKDKTALTNELTVNVTFKFSNNLPIVQNIDNTVKIQNYEDLLSIFDTSIGLFRGILFEWLNGSNLQHPLPAINIEEFLKDLRISFSN